MTQTSLFSDEPIFNWNSMRELGPRTLPYEQPVRGSVFEIELTSGPRVQVFRGEDRQFYFCHGLTFGGKNAPGGAVSPFSGKDVRIILEHHYQRLQREIDAVPGDILVWTGLDDDTPHSAILIAPVAKEGKEFLDYSTKVLTKNGRLPETETELGQIVGDAFGYGDGFCFFRRK